MHACTHARTHEHAHAHAYTYMYAHTPAYTYCVRLDCDFNKGDHVTTFIHEERLASGDRPLEQVVRIGIETVRDHVYVGLREVHFVGFSDQDVDALTAVMA